MDRGDDYKLFSSARENVKNFKKLVMGLTWSPDDYNEKRLERLPVPWVCAGMQAAPPKHTHAVSVASMEATYGLCVGMQAAPPTHTHAHAGSVASMEATHGLCASMQPAPPEQKRAGSVSSMGAARTPE